MRKLVMMILCGALLIAAQQLSFAAGGQEELLKKIELLEQQLQELKEIQKSSGAKESQCLQVFGREKFCKCLTESLPRSVNLEQYVHTVITAKESLGYASMSPEQKKETDQTLATRDKCAEKEKGGFLR